MKKIFLTTLLNAFCYLFVFSQTVVFNENFESPSLPADWTQEKVVGETLIPWITQEGGHQGNPPSAYQGTYNAFFQYQSYGGEATKLITPPIDLTDVLKPELRFTHAQDIWVASGNDWWDKLKIYYKRGADSTWVLLEEYLDPVESWTGRSILLPDSSLSSTYYIAFEGITGYGHGVCVDTVRIVETGIIPKYLESVEINQASTSFIATGTLNNPILRIDMNVTGNDGSLFLDSVIVHSLNTSDDDISTNGVKLYATTGTTFTDDNFLSSGNFSEGQIIFENMSYDIPRGYSYLWVSYDIKEDVNHELHGHIADAKINTNGISINGYLYPYIDKSPSGSREIYESLLYDNFETDKGWRFTGEFERNTPMGLIGDNGKPDPSQAVSGSYVIGTDLTIDGMYPNNLSDTAYVAEAPTLNCKYYKNIYLTFYRWLNIDLFDNARILVSSDNVDWNTVWQNSSFYTDDVWSLQEFDLSSYFTRKEQAILKFTLGPTNNINMYTGWNIDDFVIIGDYISKDVGVIDWIAPVDGCGHTDEEYVEITIKNYAGDPLTDPLPVSYSFDGGTTVYYDTILTPNIPVEGSIIYMIDKPIDLTTPGWYNNVYATTNLPGDEDNTNNTLNKTIFIAPTYTLPYSENFETNYGYYITGGTNSSWEYGTPSGTIINSAASGTNAWVTNLDNSYQNNDSSYLESPCFNFSGNDSIIFEFKCKGLSEDTIDGLTLMYSLDEGTNWYLVPDDDDFYWNWYNEELITELGLPGIDTTNGEWLTFRQLLPPAVSNQSSIKFRFAFQSNDNTLYEGFGIDDVKIYETPKDVGVTSLLEPVTQCELSDTIIVKAYIENYGITEVESGTKIPLTLKFKTETYYDTLTLASGLPINDSILFTFNQKVDMSYSGDYDFAISTDYESDTYFYNDTLSNDTLHATVTVQGMPRYNPFPDQIGDNPIDTFLVAGAGYVSYDWDRPVLADTTTLTTDTLVVINEGWYHVTVTNGDGCTANDSVEIVNSEIDLAMDSLYTEFADSCERNSLTEIKVRIKNESFSGLSAGDSIYLAYQVNDNPYVVDTLCLTDTLTTTNPGDTVSFAFNDSADFRTPGEYTFKVFINIFKDLNHADDTITATFNTWGFVDVELAHDTIYSSQADTLKLIATPGYDYYSWNNGASNDTITPSDSSYYYKVTVTDDDICLSDSDSTYIETHDLGVTAVNMPVSVCEDVASATENLNIEVTNFSGNTYGGAETIDVYYNYDNSGWIATNPVLTGGLAASGTINLTIDNLDVRSVGEHTLKIYTSSAIDADHTNDTIEYTFNTWPLPDVNLTYDTIFTTRADTIILVAQDGFATYSWDDASDNDSLIIDNSLTHLYKVEVTDVNGCGSDADSTMVITYNLGVTSLVNPKSACEHSANENVTMSLMNYGSDIIPSGTTIPVSYILNQGTPVNENYVLSADLNPSGSVNITFDQKVDLSNIDTYRFDIYSEFELDADRSNDTLIDAIKTFGYPSIELGDNIFTTQPDTVKIIADPGFNNYTWNEGTKNDTLDVDYLASKLYIVTVTDINGCDANDSVNVYTYNVGISSINTPVTTCEFGGAEILNISVINNSRDTLLTDNTIDLGYSLNGGAEVNEVLTLTSDLLPDSTAKYSFTSTLDLTTGSSHNIEVSCSRTIDVDNSNDTLDVDIEAVGYPDFTLGDDIYTTNPVETVISAPGGYATYTWQDGSSNSDFTISYPATAQYIVTVADIYGCANSDTLDIYTYDIGISSINTPVTTCEFGGAEILNITVVNNSRDTLLTDDTIDLSYSLNGEAAVNGVLTLTSDLLPDSIIDYSFASTLDLTGLSSHNIEVSCSRTIDVNSTNDTLDINIEAVGYPDFTLGDDIYTPNPVGTVLSTTPGGYDSYTWQDGSTNSNFTISFPASAQYAVTVADTYGCESSDTLEVFTYNVAADSLAAPIDQCELSSTETVTIGVMNTSEDTLQQGEPVEVGFKLNSGSYVSEPFALTAILYPGSIEFFTLDATADLSANQLHEFKLFAKLTNIDVLLTDTVTKTVNYQKTELDLGEPVASGGNEYIINPGTFDSYLWFDDSTNPTYTVDINYQQPNNYYAVTVTNEYGCEASDSLMVTFTTQPDISVTDLITPESSCWVEDERYPIEIQITNSGVINLSSGTEINVGYIIDEGAPVTEVLSLTEALNSSAAINHIFTVDTTFATADIYNFRPFAILTNDGNTSNDTLNIDIDISAPDVSLGPKDTVYFTTTVEIGTSESYETYLWNTGATTQNITVSVTGTYSVTVTDSYGCQGYGEIYCEKYTGIDNLIQGDGYTITYYPNPVADELKIEIENRKSKELIIELVNSQGQVLYSNKLTNNQNTIERIDVNKYAKGIYFIRFKIDKEFYIRKIIIQ